MGEFNFSITMDLSIPDFMDATIPLQDISNAIAADAKKNIRTQRSPDGSRFMPLSRRTINRKGFSMALLDKGIMFNAIRSYKVRKNVMAVSVMPRGKPRRDLLALIHQEIGVPSKEHGRVARPFLGVSKKREQWAVRRMERWINARIQKAAHKYINVKF